MRLLDGQMLEHKRHRKPLRLAHKAAAAESQSGDKECMSASEHLDWFALERLYYDGCRLFLRSEYDQAIAHFKRVYEETPDLWDVAELVEGYYALPRGQWIAKYRPRFEIRVSPNQPVERMAAGGLLGRLRKRLTAVIAHFFR